MSKAGKVIIGVVCSVLVICGGLLWYLTQPDKEEGIEIGQNEVEKVNEDSLISIVCLDNGKRTDSSVLNYSRNFIDSLDPGSYELVSLAAAEEGLNNGKYDAIITFPSDLTNQISTLNNGNPSKIEISYKMADNLSEEEKNAAMGLINDVYHEFNDSISFGYVKAMVDNVQDGQANVAFISENNKKLEEAAAKISSGAKPEKADFTKEPDLKIEPGVVDISDYTGIDATTFAKNLNRIYSENYKEAYDENRDNVKTSLNTIKSDLNEANQYVKKSKDYFGKVNVFKSAVDEYKGDVDKYKGLVESYEDSVEDYQKKVAEAEESYNSQIQEDKAVKGVIKISQDFNRDYQSFAQTNQANNESITKYNQELEQYQEALAEYRDELKKFYNNERDDEPVMPLMPSLSYTPAEAPDYKELKEQDFSLDIQASQIEPQIEIVNTENLNIEGDITCEESDVQGVDTEQYNSHVKALMNQVADFEPEAVIKKASSGQNEISSRSNAFETEVARFSKDYQSNENENNEMYRKADAEYNRYADTLYGEATDVYMNNSEIIQKELDRFTKKAEEIGRDTKTRLHRFESMLQDVKTNGTVSKGVVEHITNPLILIERK